MKSTLKVHSFSFTPIVTEFYMPNYYRLKNDVDSYVITSEGVLRYWIGAGFVTDMRSGSNAINPIIPKFSDDQSYNMSVLLHDVNYNWCEKNGELIHVVSREFADDLLYEMIMNRRSLSMLRAKLMWQAVHTFGRKSYEEDSGEIYKPNEKLIKFLWTDKIENRTI